MTKRRRSAATIEPQRPNDDKHLNEDGERGPLPSGHPIAWQVLTDGTLLEGTAYPLPVFL